jgi:hypothetical protein
MPINLPPEALAAEKRYRAASSPAEKISTLEVFLATIPKHKGTDKLRADLRRKLSQLKAEAQTRKRPGKRDITYVIDPEGAAQVVVIGPTNVGKSALVVALTNAAPEVSDTPYTTWKPTPGMMAVENVQIQLVDTPPLDREYVEPQLMDLIRRSDLMLLVTDLEADPIQQLEEMVALLEEHRIVPQRCQAQHEEPDRLTVKPAVLLVNKADDTETDDLYHICCDLIDDEWPMLAVSAATHRNLDRLRWAVYDQLGIIRVYSKVPGKDPDLTVPFVLKTGSTVADFAAKVHRDFYLQLRTARVWGSGAFEGQMVGRDHPLHEGDIVELRI